MLNIAFCDDDTRFLNKIIPEVKNIFRELKTNVSIYTFTNGNTLIKSFENYSPYCDVVFLDIDMPRINGKEVARKLRVIDKNFKLVFITSFEQEVLNTFQFNVISFLPKKLIPKYMFSVIKRIVSEISCNKPQIQLFKVNITRDRVAVIKIPLNDIMYFESINRKVYLHTKRNLYLLHRYKFSNLVQNYTNIGFIDIHRTCIVNIQYIFSVNNTEIHLDNGTILPLSRRKRKYVLNKFVDIVCEVTKC